MGVIDEAFAEDISTNRSVIDDAFAEDLSSKGNVVDDAFAENLSDTLKGGELSNEEVISKPQTKLDNDEPRKGDQQEQYPSEAGIRTEQVRLPELKGQKQRIGGINASGQVKGGEQSSEEDTKTESQQTQEGSQDGQGVRGKIPSGNKEEVAKGGVQAPAPTISDKATELAGLFSRGAGKGLAEIGEFGVDVLKLQWGYENIKSSAKQAEAIFGKNKYSDFLLQTPENLKEEFKKAGTALNIKPSENESILNGLVFGAGKMLPDLALAVATEGGSEAAALERSVIEPIWKSIAEKASHGMRAFAAPSLVAANTAINEEKEKGESDSWALQSGIKKLIETEAGASVPMQVSSALDNVLARGISRVAQSVPLSVMQAEIVNVANNMLVSEKSRTPTISENIINGNFTEAGKQVAQAAPMALMGVMGERVVARKAREENLLLTAGAIERNAVKPPPIEEKVAEKLVESVAQAEGKVADDRMIELQALENLPEGDFKRMEYEKLHVKQAIDARMPEDAASYFVNKQVEAGLTPFEITSRINEFKDLNERIDAAKKAKEPVKAEEPASEEPLATAEPAIEAPEGARIAAAAYIAPDGTPYTGKSHIKAMEAARDDGKITQKDIDDKQEPVSRNTEEFGYEITLPDGTRTTTTREGGAAVARASGQAQAEPFTFGEKMHSNETAKDDNPESKGLAEAIHNGDVFQYGSDKVKLISIQDDGVIGRVVGTNQEILLPKGTEGGHPKGIEGLELVKLGQQKKAPMSPKTKEALRRYLNDRVNPETNSILRSRKSEGGFIDLTALTPYLENIHDYGRAIYTKGMDFATWSAKMIKDLGKGVASALKKVYDTISQGPYLKGKSFSGSIGSAADDFARKVEGEMKEGAVPPVEGEPVSETPPEVYKTEPSWKEYETLTPKQKQAGEKYRKDIFDNLNKDKKEQEIPLMTKDELIAKIGKEEYERIESAFKDGVDISNQEEYSLLSKALNKVDMFTDDIRILGAKIPKVRNIMRSFDESTRFIAEVWDGKTIPNLSKAGAKLQATQYAHAVAAVPSRINTLMARIFPDSYKDDGLGINERKMRKTMETLAKDDIRGGYIATINELEKTNKEIGELMDVYDSGNAPSGTAGKIADLQQKAEDLMNSRDEIARVHDVEQYKKDVESTKGTYIEENINRWKEIVHPEIDDLYSRWGDSKSVPLENTGETYGARINLLSKDKEKQLDDFNENNDDIQSMSVVNYRNPDVKTLTENKSDQYSREFSTDAYNILKHSFAARTIEAKKIDLYNALIEKGAAIPRRRGEDMPLIDGKPTRLWKAKIPFKDEKTGNTSIRDVSLWVRPGVFTELTQLFGTGERFKPLPIFNAVTTIQTLGVGDGVTHTKNIHGVILNAASADPALKKLIRKLPVVGSVNAINEMLSVVKELQADTPEIRAEVDELASNVGLRGHYQPSLDLFGMHGVLHTADTAARVLLSRKFDEMVKKKVALDTPENRINYINQLGEYNRKLMSRYGAILRDLGFSPFIVAGQAMNRFSRRYILGQPGVDFASNKAALEARAMHIAGLAIVPIVGALINKATTGDFNGRPGTPVGVIDFGPAFDTEDGKRRTIDFLRLNMMRRGMRLVGLNAAIEGWKNGASLKQIQEDMKNDFVPTAMHPFIGPGLGMLVQTLTGAKIDLRTGFQGVKQSREIGGAMGVAENFRAALKEQSEFVYSLGVGKAIEYGMNKYSKTFDKLNYPEGIPAPSENQPTDVEFQEWVKPFVPTARSFIKPVFGAVGYGEIVSPALKLSAQLGMKLPYSPQQDLRYALRKEILKEVKKGNLDEAGKIFVEGRKNKILVKADENTLKGKIKEPDLLIQRVKKLKTPQDAIEVYKVASPEEQNTIIGIVAGKIGRSESVSEVKDENGISDKDRLLKEVIKSTKKGQMLYDAFKNQGSIPVEKTE